MQPNVFFYCLLTWAQNWPLLLAKLIKSTP
jgi:hypothetical protein